MRKYRIVWGELVLLLTLVVLGTAHILGVPGIELPYRIALLVGLFYLFHVLSPIRVFLGARSVMYDALIVAGFIFLAGQSAFPFLGMIAASSSLVAGAVILLVACFSACSSLPITAPSALAAFRLQHADRFKRAIVLFGLCFGFYVTVFHPMVRIMLSLSSVPFLRPVLSAALFILVLDEQRLIRIRVVERIRVLAIAAGSKFVSLLHNRKTFLLGVTGLLVVHFAIAIGYSLPDTVGAFASASGTALVTTAVSFAGTLCLFLLPLYMWRTVVRVRKSHAHLPDWPLLATSAVIVCIVTALAYPVATILPMRSGAWLAATLSQTRPLFGLGTAVIAGLVAYVIGSLDSFLRKTLMLGPFLAAMVFLGAFVYQSFVSAFSSTVETVLSYATGLALNAIPVVLLIFVVTTLFYVTGYLSFLYELWRE